MNRMDSSTWKTLDTAVGLAFMVRTMAQALDRSSAAHARHSSAVPARLVCSTRPWTESEQLPQARARTTTRQDNPNFIARPISQRTTKLTHSRDGAVKK